MNWNFDIILYPLVFIVLFALFYLLYIYANATFFNLKFGGYNKSIVGGYSGSTAGEHNESIIGGDRLKNLKKFPASKFENYVRDKFEKLTGGKFPTVYPSWLTYKGIALELDGYNEKLGIAFETQGPQHYEFNKKYYTNYGDYYTRILHDEVKVKKCEKKGIALIIIDHSVPKHLLTYYVGSRIWDVCRDKQLILSTLGEESSAKKILYSKVNCGELAKTCGVWGDTSTKPAMYIEKINRTPFRNYELEKEMISRGLL